MQRPHLVGTSSAQNSQQLRTGLVVDSDLTFEIDASLLLPATVGEDGFEKISTEELEEEYEMAEQAQEAMRLWFETESALIRNNKLAKGILPYQAEFGDPENMEERATLPYLLVGWFELLTIMSNILFGSIFRDYRPTIAAAGLLLCVEAALFLLSKLPAHWMGGFRSQVLELFFAVYGNLPSLHRMKELVSLRESAGPVSGTLAVFDLLTVDKLQQLHADLTEEYETVHAQNQRLASELEGFRAKEQGHRNRKPERIFQVLWRLRTAAIVGCVIGGIWGWHHLEEKWNRQTTPSTAHQF